MEALAPGTPRYCDVADHAKDGLADLRVALRNVLTSVRLGPLHQAMAIEGLRTDLEWQSALVARLDRETPHPLTAWLDVELGSAAELAGHGQVVTRTRVTSLFAPDVSGCRLSCLNGESSVSWPGPERLSAEGSGQSGSS